VNGLNLQGRVALITGGTRGIGLAIAQTFAAHGADVVICGHSDSVAANAVKKRIQEEYNVKVVSCFGDVGDSAVAQDMIKNVFSEFRQLDILVNNAGVLKDSIIGMIPEDEIDDVLTTNVKGVINFTQAAARLMARGENGSIVNIASIIGRVGNSGQLVYGASKAAVIGATYSAAKELAAKNIRVNAIAPGYIDTDMITGISSEKDKERRDSIAMGRIGQPEDIANTALFLASDLSAYVTGQVIGVDGGMLI